MRKHLFILLSMICFLHTSAQFTLTQDGFVATNNTSKNYIIYHCDGKTQAELYRKVLLAMNASYKSPYDIISEVPEEIITLRGIQNHKIQLARSEFFDLHYNLTLRFKDNKIRIDRPSFECFFTKNGDRVTLTLTRKSTEPILLRIFNPNNGNVELDKVKSQLESFFNDLCNQIKLSIENNEEPDW
ncbi:MAG: hypothetical protein LBV72_18290 [Tannerella sp.]|nr:hypothetical protein [Tannerella sp.]